MGSEPTRFAALVELAARLAQTPGKLEKRRWMAEFLKSLRPEEVRPGALLLREVRNDVHERACNFRLTPHESPAPCAGECRGVAEANGRNSR